MNQKQTLLSAWIRRGPSAIPAAGGEHQEVSRAPIEKRKPEELLEPEKRTATLDATAAVCGRRDVALDPDNEKAPSSSSSSSSSEEEQTNEHGVDDQGLTSYERQREALIARNREALAALGVASAAQALLCRKESAAQKLRRSRASGSKRPAGASAPSAAFPEEIAARRSSLRPRRGGVVAAAAATEEGRGAASFALPRQRTPTPEPETYDNKIVMSYIIGSGSNRAAEAEAEAEAQAEAQAQAQAEAQAQAGGGEEEKARREAQVPSPPFLPSSLRRLPLVLSGPVVRAYSVSVSSCGSLLAAGGKDGWTCIWGLRGLNEDEEGNEENDEENDGEDGRERRPLLEARLHRSWIADVALVSTTSSLSAPLLLTAANDGTLAVHDSGAAAEMQRGVGSAPRRLAVATPHGGSGIFSMAVEGFSSSSYSHFDVATASKDGSLVVSRIENNGGGIKALSTIEDAHGGGVAKCVRWRDSSTLASCGNDGAARLWDARCPYGAGAAAVEIAEATVGGVAANVVRWRNENGSASSAAPSNHLLVAGTDPEALMFDVRSPRSPLFSMKPPPAPSSGGRGSSSSSLIYQPCFTSRGAAVAVGLPRSGIVSLFDARDGKPLSRGSVGGQQHHDASTLSSFETNEGAEVVAAVGTRCLHLFASF